MKVVSMKAQIYLFSILLFGLSASYAETSATTAKKIKVSSYIAVTNGADLNQYDDTASKTRDQMRSFYMNELVEATKALAQVGGNPDKLIVSLAAIQDKLDQKKDQHMATDTANIGYSLSEILKSNILQLYSSNNITDPNKKNIQFVNPFLKIKNGLQADTYITMTFTIMGSHVYHADVIVGDLNTGEEQSFGADGSIHDVMKNVAQIIFDFYQPHTDSSWVDPNPQLKWKISANNVGATSAYQAKQFCAGQGMRLPYSQEMLLAQAGGAYHDGGIPQFKAGAYYMTANKGRARNTDYALKYGNSWDQAPIPSVVPVTAGGFAIAQIVCVQGQISTKIIEVQKLYELSQKYNPGGVNYRFFGSTLKNAKIVQAIESLLFVLDPNEENDQQNILLQDVLSEEEARQILQNA